LNLIKYNNIINVIHYVTLCNTVTDYVSHNYIITNQVSHVIKNWEKHLLYILHWNIIPFIALFQFY